MQKKHLWKNREQQIKKVANEGIKRETFHLKRVQYNNKQKIYH